MSALTFQVRDLLAGLNAVKHAAADDESRPILATILFEGDAEGFRLVAADNYRIAIAEVTPADGDASTFGRRPIFLPDIKVLLVLLRQWHKATVKVTPGEQSVTFSLSYGQEFSVQPVHGTWPNYGAVIDQVRARAAAASVTDLNPRYLEGVTKGAKAMDEILVAVQTAGLAPVAFIGKRYREYIMPVRTSEAEIRDKEAARQAVTA